LVEMQADSMVDFAHKCLCPSQNYRLLRRFALRPVFIETTVIASEAKHRVFRDEVNLDELSNI